MRCRRALKLVSRRVDGALASDHAAALEDHLATCAPCRVAAAAMSEAWGALAVLERPVDSVDDWTRIEGAVEGRSSSWSDAWQASLTPLRPASVALLAGMVVLGATGGVLITRAGTARTSADSIESRVFTETLGDLGYGSPASGIALVLDTRAEKDQ